MNRLKYYVGSFLLAWGLCGCESSDIMLYEQNPGVYFIDGVYSYSFLEDPQATSKLVKLGVDITGSQVDYDREFVVTRPAVDTITTAEDDQYIIGKGVVKANECTGYVEVEILRDDRLNDSIYTVALEIQPGKDFPETRLNKKIMELSFTNKVVQPANWKWLRWYFGTPFSTRWWLFICEATGRTSLPYYPNQDPEVWWMSVGEVTAYQTIVRLALEEYNAKHPGKPLTHDDGDYAGQPVEMPS